MTDINLKDFDKNNWDEFVHLGALKDVIDQDNAINKEQDENISTNKADIATNKQGIADNKSAIDANKADIATNKQGIADNKSAIDANKADIATNKQGIADNKSAIDANKADIATNKQGIADNKTAINDLENKAILKDATKTSVDKTLTNVNVNGTQSMGSMVQIKQISFPDFNENAHQVSDIILSFMGPTLLNDDKQIVLTYDEIENLQEFTGTGTVFANDIMVYATIHVTATEIDIAFPDNVVTQLEALKAPYRVQAKLTVF